MSLPDRDAILAFIRQTPGAVGKREIARAFGLHGDERAALKELLADMEADGQIAAGAGRSLRPAGSLLRVAVLVAVVAEGARVIAEPERWEGEGPPPRVAIASQPPRGRGAGQRLRIEAGDRLLVRIEGSPPKLLGTVIRRLGRGHAQLMGVVALDGAAPVLRPVDRRTRRIWPLHQATDLAVGTLVRAELRGSGARAHAVVTQSLGTPMEGRMLSAIAIAAKGIPDVFPDAVEAAAERVGADPDLGPREDWTAIPFITIDPADARDHDDALWAAPLGDGGFELVVAIADVAWYVRPGTALDRAAFERGNSVYFPDQVVPMLPHALSAGACSLKAGADKAVVGLRMRVDARGAVTAASVHRARVRMAANLSYEEAQAAADAAAGPWWDAVLAPLWGCWRALDRARAARAPLDLDLPERRVILDAGGDVAGVVLRERFDAHRVVEEMMIAANVAAAGLLEQRRAPVMYRCHEPPDREKLTALKEYLGTLGIALALGQVITPATFNRVLARVAERPDAREVAEAVLRAQTQAYYAPRNAGHFGLSLASYAHFTSPIRRYADVLVHRSLVAAFALGEGGLPAGAEARFAAIGEHVSLTERRAMEAERETLDRYVARHLEGQVGHLLDARITGVQAFGLFATVEAIGGDGLVPVSALGDERFHFDAAARALVGERSGTRHAVGDRLQLKLEEADPATGALRFSLPGVTPAERRAIPGRQREGSARPRLDRRRGSR